MRQNPEFIITDVGKDHILVPVGRTAVNFNAVITLNDMGRDIWALLEKDMSEDELVKSILQEYDVSEEQARADLRSFLRKLQDSGCIIED